MKQCKTNTGGATRPHPGRRRRAERKRDPLCARGASRRQVGPQGWAEQGDRQCGEPGGGGVGNVGCPAVREPRSSGGEGICEGWFKGSFYFLF